MTEQGGTDGGQEQPATVTEFAAEHGTAEGEGVAEAVQAEQEAAQEGTERAQQVSEAMAGEDAEPVPPEEGSGIA